MNIVRQWIQRLVAPIDPILMLLTSILFTYAFLAVLSASPERAGNQLMNTVVALVVMRVLASIPPQRLMHLAPPIFVGGVLLLIGVALFGDISKGARRWLNVGFMRIQPSELMKIAMPLMLAWYFQKYEAHLRLRDFGIAALLLLIPTALIARQPDLGTAILVFGAGFYVIFFAGLPWKIIIGMGLTALASAPIAWTPTSATAS
jgi:rod shape determining protein RodA